MTDDTLLQWDEQPSDFMALGWGMTAYDLAIGSARWRFPDADDVDMFAPWPIMALGSEFVVEYHWERSRTDSDVIHAVFDPTTGDRRVLLRQDNALRDGLTARYDLSAESHVVLEREDAEARSHWTFATIEVSSGTLIEDAFTVDPPWLCDAEYCFRD